jgi:hypothetical protein
MPNRFIRILSFLVLSDVAKSQPLSLLTTQSLTEEGSEGKLRDLAHPVRLGPMNNLCSMCVKSDL